MFRPFGFEQEEYARQEACTLMVATTSGESSIKSIEALIYSCSLLEWRKEAMLIADEIEGQTC